MFFEIDDIKRRHSGYFDVYNSHGWIDAPDDQLGWTLFRGMVSSIPAMLFQEGTNLLRSNYDLMTKNYEPPRTFEQCKIYAREILKLDNFKGGIKNRAQYAILFGGVYLGPSWALWRWMTSGLHRSDIMTINFEFWRVITPTVLSAAATCWLSVPIETAKAAYYADRTYPEHLKKGYKSIVDTLIRIPKEEGFYYLWKGAAPIMARNYTMFSGAVYLYDFLRDWFFVYQEGNDMGGDMGNGLARVMPMAISVYFGALMSCPWDNFARYLYEFEPSINGKRYYESYRQALVAAWYFRKKGQYFVGFHGHFLRHAPYMFGSMYIAENMGLFSRWKYSVITNPGSNDPEYSFQ